MKQVLKSGVLYTVLALSLLVGRAEAQVVYSNFGAGNSYNVNSGHTVSSAGSIVGGPFVIGVSFTPAFTGNLSLIEVAIGLANGQNHLDLTLANDVAGLPGAAIETFSVDNKMGPFGLLNPPVSATSALAPLLTAGTTYWVYAVASGNTWAAWNYNSINDNGPIAYSDFGSRFAKFSFTRPTLRVSVLDEAQAVPEPGSIALICGLGIPALMLIRRRRK